MAAFVFVYAAYGLNYICSVFMSPDTAQMMAVGDPEMLRVEGLGA